MDLLQPEYNILKVVGSSFGYKHTKEALVKIVASKIGKNILPAQRE